LFFLVVRLSSTIYFSWSIILLCFRYDKETAFFVLLHCKLVDFGGRSNEGKGLCLFGLISDIKCFSEITYCAFKGVMFVPQAALKRTAKIGIDFLASFQTQPTHPHINCSKKKKKVSSLLNSYTPKSHWTTCRNT